jgi:Zn-dependent alcohol dehydrogenase
VCRSADFAGVYGVSREFPAIGGGEGVGVVTKVGSDVTSFREGDWVVPASTTLGD